MGHGSPCGIGCGVEDGTTRDMPGGMGRRSLWDGSSSLDGRLRGLGMGN